MRAIAHIGATLVCLLAGSIPAFSQITPPEPDPLARIQAQPPQPVCSEAEPTLCAEAAPKIIANATGSDSTIEKNLQVIASGEGGNAMGAPRPASEVAEVRAVDWAYSMFRAAGIDAQTETFASPASAAPGQKAVGGENVVAEIRGREKPDEIVILGAHLDTSVLSENSSGDNYDAAVVIEAARDIFATGLAPRRTIRFVLFADPKPGGAQGSAGAAAYVGAHRDELDHVVAAIIFAAGEAHISGYSLGARHDIEAGVREALAPLASLETLTVSFDAPLGADNFDFLLEGVPNLLASGPRAGPAPKARGASGAINQVDIHELQLHAAIAGVTAFDVAEDEAPLGPRLSAAEVQALLDKAESH